MSKILRWFFRPYMEDDYSVIRHNGVGYTGLFGYPNLCTNRDARVLHSGVGYTGVYDE